MPSPLVEKVHEYDHWLDIFDSGRNELAGQKLPNGTKFQSSPWKLLFDWIVVTDLKRESQFD